MVEIKVKKDQKVEGKSELEKDAEEAASVVKAGARAVFKKLDGSYKDLKEEYKKEKLNES